MYSTNLKWMYLFNCSCVPSKQNMLTMYQSNIVLFIKYAVSYVVTFLAIIFMLYWRSCILGLSKYEGRKNYQTVKPKKLFVALTNFLWHAYPQFQANNALTTVNLLFSTISQPKPVRGQLQHIPGLISEHTWN